MEPSHRYGLAGLIAAKIVCCGALVLAATGATSLAGFASWLAGGGLFWLSVVILAIIGIYLWRRSAGKNDDNVCKARACRPLQGRSNNPSSNTMADVETRGRRVEPLHCK
jgi:membrane protein implicated in regulation of membrane protease activity